MLRLTKRPSRLYLTDELRADEVVPKPALRKVHDRLFAAESARFPPVEDLVALVDRTALRAFVA